MRGSLFHRRLLPALSGVSILFFLAAAPAAYSQTMTTDDILGTVTDASGAVVPNAKVTAKLVTTNEIHTAVSNSSGQYRFTLLQPGEYEVTGEATGLKSKTEKFTLLVGQETAINLKLEVQGTTEVIEVQGEATILQTENGNQASGFDTQQMVQLPAMGGDITTIAFTVPGVLVGKGGGNFVSNGIPGDSTLFTINGTDDMDPFLNINNSGSSNNLLGSNEVAEASVVLNAFSADYGRMSGAQVNYVTKTGSNAFHGNVFHNYNDKIFNANDFFNNQEGLQEPRSDSHNFGGNLGGPIKKNKVFFYYNYESLRYALPTSNPKVEIPSPQLETYTLAHIPQNADTLALYNDAFALWNNAPGAKNAIPELNGTGPLQDGNDHLGCGTQTFWNAGIAAPGGGVFGTTVPCTYVFGADTSLANIEDLMTLRGDYNINDKQKISARVNYDWGLQATSASYISPVYNVTSNQPSANGQLTYTYAISPNLVNNFIGSGYWYAAVFTYPQISQAISEMPETFSPGDGCCTSVGMSASFPQGRNVGQAQIVDDVTWIKGHHSFKAGVNYRHEKITDFTNSEGSIHGTYSFADLTDFTDAQINATGKGDAFTQKFPNELVNHFRMAAIGAYVQDEWKVRKNVSLTLGFRIEHNADPTCIENCFARMNVQFGTPGYVGGATVPYNQTITTGLHDMYQSIQGIIPEPRFGFAWNIDSKTVLRGGIGLFATLFAGSVADSIASNSPSVFSPSVKTGIVGLPTDTASSAFAAFASENALQTGFVAGDTLTQIQAAVAAQHSTFAAPSYYSPPNSFVSPQTTEWSAELERAVDSHDVLALTYTGNHGYNQALSNTWANSFLLLGSNGLNAYYGTNFGGLPTAAPDPRFLTVTQVLTKGYSNYDAMTLQLRHSMKWGFQGQIGWTWSHDLGLSGIYNPYNLGLGYGNEGIDVRHAIVSDLVWTEPHKFSNAFLRDVIGGWNFGLKMYIYGGTPFTTSDSKIAAQINSGGGTGSLLAEVYNPALPTVCTAVHGTSTPPCWTTLDFDTYNSTSGVNTPVQNSFGQTGPGVFRGPGYFDIDTQLTKKFFIKEKYAFEVGAQIYNTLNHPNFSNPTASITSGSLGTTSGDVGPPTSPYGSGQGSLVTGRLIVVTGKFSF
jgi:hypothetical protein